MSRRSQKREQQRQVNKKITLMDIGKLANELRQEDGVSYEKIMENPNLIDHYNDEAKHRLKLSQVELFSDSQHERVSNAEKTVSSHAFKSNGDRKVLLSGLVSGPPVGENTSTYKTGRQLYGASYGQPVKGLQKRKGSKR